MFGDNVRLLEAIRELNDSINILNKTTSWLSIIMIFLNVCLLIFTIVILFKRKI